MGQKRYFLRDFAEVLEQVEGQIDTVVDLFGGSYLSVLRLLRGTKYIYFTSDKSQIVELCRFMADEYGEAAPMYGATVRMRTNHLNYQAKFNDMMITKL